MKKTSDFLIDCLSNFGSILGAYFHHLCFQKYVRIGKGDFMKMSFSCTRGAHFQGFRPPRSIQKSMKKIENETLFWIAFGRFGSHSVTILESKSHLKIDRKINAILDRFFNDFGPFLGSRWGPLRAPGCHRDAPKTLQDALKTLPRCSQDAQGRQ